jgi:PST family polysaccharide transporter
MTFGLSKGVAFGSLLVLTRLLAPSEFGVVAAVVVVLGLIELCADLGMKATVIYEQEDGSGDRVQTAFTLNLLVASALTAVGVLAAPAVADFFHVGHHVWLFRLAALDVLLTGLGSIHDGLLLRDLRFRPRIGTEIAGALARAGVGVSLALAGFGAAALVWGMLAGTAAWVVAQWSLSRFRPTFRLDRAIARTMVAYGIGAALLEVLAVVTTRLDAVAVGRILGQRALGLYTVAFRLPDLLLESIAWQVSLVAFPALARKRAIDAHGLAAATLKLVRYQSVLALPLAAGMAVLARPLIGFVFSPRWSAAAGVFAAVSVMSGITAAGFALGDAFKASGRQRVMVGLNLIQLPVLVVTVLAAGPYGITAVAWARAGGGVLWVALMCGAAARVLDIPCRETVAAMGPGIAGAGGVAIAAEVVHHFWGTASVEALAAACLAGTVGGAVALALLAPATGREIRAGGLAVCRRVRRRGAGVEAAGTVGRPD